MDVGYGHASLFAHHHEWSTSCLERASGGPSSPSQAPRAPLLRLLFSVRGWGLGGVRGPRNSRGRIPTSFPFTVGVCLCVQAQVQRQVESAFKWAIAMHPRNNFPEGIPKHLKTPGETWAWEIIIPYLEIALSSKSENSECFINSERLKEFTKLLLVSVSGTICKLVWIEWQFEKTLGGTWGSLLVTLPFLLFQIEEDHLYALRWKELEMHSLALQGALPERTWSDERNLVQQELRSLKQNIFLFYIKLRWLLKHWRQGKQMEEEGEDFTEVPPPGEFTGSSLLFASILFLTPRHCCAPPHRTQSCSVSSDCFVKSAPGDGNAMGCPVIFPPEGSGLSFDLVARVYGSVTPFCNSVLLPSLLLLIFFFF